jgi:hypothetical protein
MGKFLVSISFFINIIHQILAHLLNSGKHGRSNRLHNQKMTTYVSTSVFQAIQKLFPNAITLPVVITDGQFETCSECSREKSYMAHLPGKLLNLVASNEKIFEPFKSFDDINRKGCLRLIHSNSFPAKVASLIKQKCPPKKVKKYILGNC